MSAAIESQSEQVLRDHLQDKTYVAELEGGFRQDRLAGQQRLGHLFGDTDRPLVIPIASASKRDQKSRIGDGLQPLEKPFRVETLVGPSLMAPASRMNFFDA